MSLYLTTTQYSTYQYRRRVPKLLTQYIPHRTIKVSLGSILQGAQLKAIQYNRALDEALEYVKASLPSEYVQEVLSIFTKEDVQLKEEARWGSLSSKYIKSKVGKITEGEINKLKDFSNVLAPTLFSKVIGSKDPIVSTITANHLESIKHLLTDMPKRNIQRYKKVSVSELLKLDIPSEDKVSTTTLNRYLKLIKTLFSNFNLESNPAEGLKLLKNTTSTKEARSLLSEVVLEATEAKLSTTHTLLFNALKYSGLRPSELLKCKVTTVDNVLVFDLTDDSIELKTASSRRVVPIHSKLIPYLDELQEAVSNTNNMEPLSRNTTKILRELGSTTTTLYSLRHTFITKLIQEGVEANVVSSLVGHSLEGNSMTVGRYFKGYKVQQLKDAIERLT